MNKVHIVIDDRTNVIVKVFNKRSKALDYIEKEEDPQWFILQCYEVE